VESLKERDHSEDQGRDGRMGSKCILGRLAGGGLLIGFNWLRIGNPVADCCEHGDEPSGPGTTELLRAVGVRCPVQSSPYRDTRFV
jgi:hypothetical protein